LSNVSRSHADPRTAVAYVRVSTDEQHLGPEAQRAAIEAWATRESVHVLAWHVDHGVSGAAPLDKRPGLLAALETLRERRAGVLLAAKRDRVARDVVAAATIERMAAKVGAKVVTADGVSTADTPEGMLMRTLIDAFAQYERALIATRTAAALAAKRRKGERVGQVPYGCRLAADGLALEPEPVEQRVIDRVRTMRDEGETIDGIAAQLNAEGVPARGRRWHATTVRRILVRGAAEAA
jgi:DNA invertase Pin-like site-specific DNA recombinase